MEKILSNKVIIKGEGQNWGARFRRKKGGRETLIIKSIPYQVNKSILIENAQLVEIKKLRELYILEMS